MSTFYKYTNLLSLKRKWRKSSEENYNPIITTKPNEFIHIDTTFWSLPNGIKAAIILVCDNFSKAILGWNVSLKKDGENAKAALQNAVESIQKQYPDLQTASLITDGGGENHNMLVEDFLTNIEAPEIIKLLALKEVKFSNSAVEAVNKIIKRYLRKKLPDTLDQLIQCLKEIINDYNTIRPHGSLLGLTPMECYTSESINLDFKQQKLEAKKNRIQQNQSVNCGIDVCK
nr:integrase core domain-containing protein [uncultured Brumimicrobium sp.]